MTISEIAERSNVSKATVSRVLNHTGYVSKDVAERVLRVIEETGYVPSAAARRLSKQSSDTIGVIISEITNPYFAKAVEGIGDVADAKGLNVFFYNTDANEEKEKKALYMMRKQQVSGIIIAPTVDFDDISSRKAFNEAIDQLQCPLVFLDASIDMTSHDGAFFDNTMGAYTAVSAMIEAGYRDIGILTGNRKVKTVRDRYNGYVRALCDNNLKLDLNHVFEGDFTIDTAYKVMSDAIRSGNLPEALFTSNNLSTIGFMKAALEAGIDLEKDVACISFDKAEAADIFGIKYNYLERDPQKMGQAAMQLLIDRIENPDMPCTRKIIPSSIVLQKNR